MSNYKKDQTSFYDFFGYYRYCLLCSAVKFQVKCAYLGCCTCWINCVVRRQNVGRVLPAPQGPRRQFRKLVLYKEEKLKG